MGFNFNRKKFAYGSQALLSRDVLRASAVLDFPSIAAGATATLTVTVKGAAVGDDTLHGFIAAPTAGLSWHAWVSATDTVTLRATNVTAGAIDPASATFRVIVLKQY